MTFGLRSLAFVAEFLHPPVKHEASALQRVHGQLFAQDGVSYRDFTMTPGGAQMSNAAGGLPGAPVSTLNFTGDRIQIREEQTGASHDDFAARIVAVAELALRELPLNLFMVQQFAVRSVVNPSLSEDSRAFVVEQLMGLDANQLSLFGEQPNLAGVRLSFPPQGEQQAVFNVRIESFSQDNRSLFLENVGTFARPLAGGSMGEQLTARFGATYDFLQERLVTFVDRIEDEEF